MSLDIDEGSDWKESAKKELSQETGYSVKKHNLAPLFRENGGIYLDPALGSTRFLPVLAKKCELSEEQDLEDTEYVIVQKPMSLKTWKKKIYEGELVDAKSIVTTLLALHELG